MLWSGSDEAFRGTKIGLVEDVLSLLDDLWCHAVMEHVRRQQSDSAVMVFVVVPREEALTKNARILDGSESIWELGPVFESFELALRVRVVI